LWSDWFALRHWARTMERVRRAINRAAKTHNTLMTERPEASKNDLWPHRYSEHRLDCLIAKSIYRSIGNG